MPNLSDKERDERKWYCVGYSLKKGFQSATITVAITGSLVFLANKYSDGFRKRLSISGKTATAVIYLKNKYLKFLLIC